MSIYATPVPHRSPLVLVGCLAAGGIRGFSPGSVMRKRRQEDKPMQAAAMLLCAAVCVIAVPPVAAENTEEARYESAKAYGRE